VELAYLVRHVAVTANGTGQLEGATLVVGRWRAGRPPRSRFEGLQGSAEHSSRHRLAQSAHLPAL